MALIYFLPFFFSFSFVPRPSQPIDRWLVELRSASSPCLADWQAARGLHKQDYLLKKLPIGNWYVVEVPASYSEDLKSLPCISSLMADQKIDWRDKEPNDPAFINQADMQLIGMPKAWDVTTGGRTENGDTIVAAIIDEGFEINHPDLIDNIWHNFLEIPGDGIDNDNNGYKDDYVGYNIKLENDQHPVKSHGTSVAGIIGAVGNNDIGVTGVNWSVKLLLISGADFESELIESYQYVLEMRNLYDETNGQKGAFVVVTNLSAGVNNAFAADHPLWCMMYDKLGEKGILSVCAAPNISVSVDEEGDMPTTCTSEYMIAVTNVDLTDEILGNAGYGVTSIDIGAPGHGTVTTASGFQYKEFPGTSSATPHVTGTIALMYSTPCNQFLHDIDSDPAGVARKVRDIIFSTGKINNSLGGITVTGKRLQTDAAVKATLEACLPQVETRVEITYIRPNLVGLEGVEVGFEATGDTSGAVLRLYTVTGAEIASYALSQDDIVNKKLHIPTASLPAATYVATLWNGKLKSSAKFVVY